MKNKNLGVIIVHLGKKMKKYLTYKQGSVKEGLKATNKFLREATEKGWPIFYYSFGPLIKEVYKGIKNFEYQDLGNELNYYTKEMKKLEKFVVFGCHGSACARKETENILYRGKSVDIPINLLFGNDFAKDPLSNNAKEFYSSEENCNLYESYQDLMKQN